MKKIDIRDLESLQSLFSNIQDKKPLLIQEGKEEKFAVITMNDYEEFMKLYYADIERNPLKYGKPKEVHIFTEGDDDYDISEEEYEDIKKQLLDAIEKTFKPKTNKMN